MERKSSFKECPKCGLRNKPGATQCDFCGQNLGTSDDWQQHIKDLESLNKMELRKPLDDQMSKRIASTIIRKDAPVTRNVGIKEAGSIGKVLKDLDEPPAKDKALDAEDERPRQVSIRDKLRIKEVGSIPLVERDAEETPPVSEGPTIADILKEPTKEIVEQPSPEPETPLEPVNAEISQPPAAAEPQPFEKLEERIATAPVPETSDEAVPANEVTAEIVQPFHEHAPSPEAPSDEEQQVTVSSNDSQETIKLVEVERPKEKLVPITIAHRTPRPTTAAIAVLALGSVAYLVVLALTAIGLFDTAVALGGGAVSSFMIVFGAAAVYPSLRKKNDDEVYICPKCHEKVGQSSDGCPACGAEFESER